MNSAQGNKWCGFMSDPIAAVTWYGAAATSFYGAARGHVTVPYCCPQYLSDHFNRGLFQPHIARIPGYPTSLLRDHASLGCHHPYVSSYPSPCLWYHCQEGKIVEHSGNVAGPVCQCVRSFRIGQKK